MAVASTFVTDDDGGGVGHAAGAMMEAKPDKKAFKDWFDREAAKMLGAQVKQAWSGFDTRAFLRRATKGLDALEFAGRVKQFSGALAAGLPDDIPKALGILTDSLPPAMPDCESVTDGWLQWPVGQFIADHGLPHFDASMDAMTALTQRFSSEFAVRPFVAERAEETFARLRGLTDHESPHVRRWCSEGVRPRLPWGAVLRDLVADPAPIWPILEALDGDPELYVRRSVANNLGDIAKDHSDAAIAWAAACVKRGGDERMWIAKHGLRTPIKSGNPKALAVLGYKAPKKVEATLRVAPKRVAIGGAVELEATLSSSNRTKQALMVDFVVHYVRKKGTGAKAFKWTTCTLAGGEATALTKKHAMKRTSIRALYPGKHQVELQVNGVVLASTAFTLTA